MKLVNFIDAARRLGLRRLLVLMGHRRRLRAAVDSFRFARHYYAEGGDRYRAIQCDVGIRKATGLLSNIGREIGF